MKHLKLYEDKYNNNLYDDEYFLVGVSSYQDSQNYTYDRDNEFKSEQDALDWIFNNYYVDIDPDKNRHDLDTDETPMIYGKDIRVFRFLKFDADITDALNNIKMD